MVWIQFIVSAALIVLAAIKLAEYGDVIAVRTKLGGMFIGTLLLAGATSLPELLSSVNAVFQSQPNLAAGSMLGSNMFNMFMLAVLDLANQQARILRRVAMSHALTASLATLLMGLAAFAILADVDARLGWIGWDSLLIIIVYLGGVWLIQRQGGTPPSEIPEDQSGIPSLRKALLGFAIATTALVIVVPYLVSSSSQIGEITGLSAGFVGATLIGITTSLPELVATIAAVRVRAFDLAVGNLFGSNVFNMFALGLTDAFYKPGRFLGGIDPSFALLALLGLLLTSLALIGNLARVERRIVFMELDALLILIGYLLGMYFLYSQGIGA
ncbi:MAG: sodium:calcium antiporter [Anaerolineales bacterium]|nr:sodium:calcium antiporter [Anaerolineales bacterium]